MVVLVPDLGGYVGSNCIKPNCAAIDIADRMSAQTAIRVVIVYRTQYPTCFLDSFFTNLRYWMPSCVIDRLFALE